MKRLRRFFIVLTGMLILLMSVGFYVRHRTADLPEWYHPFAMDEQTRNDRANDMDQRLIGSYSNANHAQLLQNLANTDDTSTRAISLYFTEDEINAWADKWNIDPRVQWKKKLANRLHDPVLLLKDGRLILAAMSTDWDVVVSMHFEPRLEGGMLNLHLQNVMAGTLPLPKWMWSRFVDSASQKAEQNLAALQAKAEVDTRGRANQAAIDAELTEFLLHVLRDEPAEAVLFLPEPSIRNEHERRCQVMQITHLDISNKTLTLKIEPMTNDQREALLQRIRGPVAINIGLGK